MNPTTEYLHGKKMTDCYLNYVTVELHNIRILRDDISPCKYHDITKYHDMYNNGDYGTSFHYTFIQSSYSNSGAVSRHCLCHTILSILHTWPFYCILYMINGIINFS